jgi:integrase
LVADFQMLRLELADFAKRAGCTDASRITPHRLRHTWASDMLRCGITMSRNAPLAWRHSQASHNLVDEVRGLSFG